MEKVEVLLKEHKLRKTAIRMQVLEVFFEAKEALSSSLIEERLDKIDRITLYRTLRTFEKNGLIHKAIDGTDKLKYALCQSNCTSKRHKDNHVHFRCGECKKTYCLEEIPVPQVTLPKGFRLDATHIIMEGICNNCFDNEHLQLNERSVVHGS